MRIAVSADELVGVAGVLVEALERRGHEVSAHGALAPTGPARGGEEAARGEGQRIEARPRPRQREGWAWCSEAAAREVTEGRAQQAIVCCWTGTGASIAANKVAGVRAALCVDAATADGARRWNDANVLALSLRSTSQAELEEILDAWFAGAPSTDADDRASIAHLIAIERTDPAFRTSVECRPAPSRTDDCDSSTEV